MPLPQLPRGVSGPWHSALACQVTLFMGLQSLGYYVVLTWLPEIFQEEVRMSAAWAGWMLALAQVVDMRPYFSLRCSPVGGLLSTASLWQP